MTIIKSKILQAKQITLFVLLIVITAVLFAGCSDDKSAEHAAVTQENTDEGTIITTLSVKRMICGRCVAAITDALTPNEGIINVTVDLNAGIVVVEHEPGVTVDEIKNVIIYDAGFTVEGD